MFRKFAVLLAMLLVQALVACNTIEGAGEDLEAAGQGVERGADESK